MYSLSTELSRLFGTDPLQPAWQVQPDGTVRALVLGLSGPAGWAALAQVWRAAQADLEWPAAAIAVNGRDGYLLCWPLAQPLLVAQAHACVRALAAAYLPQVKADRLRLWPDRPDAAASVWPLPPQAMPSGEVWSAFVAPDLAPVFDDTPWLDVQPSPEGQAELLVRIKPVLPMDLQRAWAEHLSRALKMAPAGQASTSVSASASAGSRPEGAGAVSAAAPASDEPGRWAFHDPRDFLRAVMNDGQVDMTHRIEAAKALLQAP